MEIEKKYTIKKLPENLQEYEVKEIEQGYLSHKPIIRIRKSNQEYILTYKSKNKEDTDDVKVCREVELPLTKESYEHLKEKVDGQIVSKKRYLIPIKGTSLTIELDMFTEQLEGLCFAEVEFPSVEAANQFDPPEWFDKNVSDDINYQNWYLSTLKKWEN